MSPYNQPVGITLEETTPVICEKCNSDLFSQKILVREISPLITGNSSPQLVTIPVFVCDGCGTRLEKYLPETLRTKKIVS